MLMNVKLIDLSNIEDFKTLERYRRIFIVILKSWGFSAVAMASGLAIGLMFGFSDVELVVLVVLTAVMAVTFIPAVFSWILLEEIEAIYRARFYPKQEKFSNRMPIFIMKMMFWYILAVFAPGLIRIIVDFFTGQ